MIVSRGSKTFKEFVEEAYLIEGQSREEAEKKRQSKENPDEWRVRKVGRRGEESWTTKRKSSLSGQGKTRTGSAKQQTDPEVNPSEYKAKTSKIADANKEAHHKVSLTRAKELFSGKTPEERQEIRARHARIGVHFGNDPRNIIGLSRERHTGGKESVHREIERMDRSIKKAGEKSSRVFDAIKKLREEFKRMPGKLMTSQIDKLSRKKSDLQQGRQTQKKRDRFYKYEKQINAIKLAKKQNYNRKGESYGQFHQDPLKTGKLINHRFR